MRSVFLLALTLSALTQTQSRMFDLVGDLLSVTADVTESLLDWGVYTADRLVNTDFQVGGSRLGAMVDPFGWWTSSRHGHHYIDENVRTCPAKSDIVFMIGTSGYRSSENHEQVYKFVHRLTRHFQIGSRHARFAAINFSDRVRRVFDFDTYETHEGLSLGLAGNRCLGRSTKTYLALDYVRQGNVFSTSRGAREDATKIVVVITDASSDSLASTTASAEVLKRQYHVIAVGVGSGTGTELRSVASSGRDVFMADNFASLFRLEHRVARRLCEIPEADGNIPAEGSGTDSTTETVPATVSVPTTATVTVPTTTSTTATTAAPTATVTVPTTPPTTTTTVTVPTITTATVPTTPTATTTTTETTTTTTTVPTTTSTTTSTTTTTTVPTTTTTTTAIAPCSKGFKRNPNNSSSCVDINECKTGHSCQQTCVNMIGSYRCTCEAGSVIDPKDTSKCLNLTKCLDAADIIFALDASSSIGPENFKIQQTFVAKLTHHFKFGPRAALFGGLLFATNVEKLFELNTYTSRTDVTSALMEAPYLEGETYTHLALKYIVDNRMFSTASGGRSNVQDVLVIVTDGSASKQQTTKVAADTLKAKGVTVFAVGIGEQVDLQQLIELASSSQDVLSVFDFTLLDYIEQELADRICSSISG